MAVMAQAAVSAVRLAPQRSGTPPSPNLPRACPSTAVAPPPPFVDDEEEEYEVAKDKSASDAASATCSGVRRVVWGEMVEA